MDPIFQNADPDKMNRIIIAAIEEFSKYPYEKASTNNIVKNAGISKGLLFHYFASKQDLYEKLVGFVLNKLFDEITSRIDWDEEDVFERIKALIIIKIRIGRMYPNMFEFVIKVLSEKNVSNLSEAKSLYEKYGIDMQSMLSEIYVKNINFTLFRNPHTIDKSINIVRWTLEKYSEERLLPPGNWSSLDYGKISEEMDAYINVLKDMLYSKKN